MVVELWESAEATAHDLLARLAVVPLVLEARGLDVSTAMITNLRRAEDHESANVFETIYEEEIAHVAIGRKWFDHFCALQGENAEAAFHRLVRAYFRGTLKPPFNESARSAAGLEPGFYRPLSADAEA